MRVQAPARAGAVLLWLALLGGCAAPQTIALVERPPSGLPQRAEIESAPFFAQEDYQCGPAALATALMHAGVDATPETLVPQVYVPARKGSLQVEMLAAARRRGLVAYPLAPRLDDVLRELAGGTPVITLQNLSLAWLPVWHYAVVVGYDLPEEHLVLRSGVTRRLVMTMANFELTWARSGHWAMVALPPERIPVTANEADFVSAVAALERGAPGAARRAYAAALLRWPTSLRARIGAGNAAYAERDLAAAAAEYRRATLDHPASGDAWNNLAQALYELGRADEARGAARRAVALGGVRLPEYRETLRAIGEAR